MKNTKMIVLVFLSHFFVSASFESIDSIRKTSNTHTTDATNATNTIADNTNINFNFDPKKEPKLPAQFARLKDPSYSCLPGDKGSEGPEIFANVDCNHDGARWDYNYQVKNNNIWVVLITPYWFPSISFYP